MPRRASLSSLRVAVLLRGGESLLSFGSAAALQLLLATSGILAARLLGVEHRGEIALLALYPLALSQVGTLGLPTALTYFISRSPADAGEIVRSILKPAVIMTLALTLLHALLLFGLYRGDSSEVRWAALVSLMVVPGASAQLFGVAILQGQRRFFVMHVFRLLSFLLYGAGLLVLMLAASGTLPAVTLVWSISAVLAGFGGLLAAFRGLPKKRFATSEAPKGVLPFGLKSMAGWISPAESFHIDQFAVGFFAGPAALGFYVISLAFTNLPRFVGQSVGLVAYPQLARAGEDARQALWSYVGQAAIVTGAAVVMIELALDMLVPTLFGLEFSEAVGIARVLLLASFFLSVRRVLGEGARGLGYPELSTRAEIVSWATLVPFIALFGSTWGALGVAWSMVLSSIVAFVTVFYLALTTFRKTPASAVALQMADG